VSGKRGLAPRKIPRTERSGWRPRWRRHPVAHQQLASTSV